MWFLEQQRQLRLQEGRKSWWEQYHLHITTRAEWIETLESIEVLLYVVIPQWHIFLPCNDQISRLSLENGTKTDTGWLISQWVRRNPQSLDANIIKLWIAGGWVYHLANQGVQWRAATVKMCVRIFPYASFHPQVQKTSRKPRKVVNILSTVTLISRHPFFFFFFVQVLHNSQLNSQVCKLTVEETEPTLLLYVNK